MPIFRVTIEERHNDWFEEIYHACREMFCRRVYEVEAENEEEAQQLAEEEDGTLLEEDWDYGGTLESEYYDTGESYDSEYVDSDVVIETLEDWSERHRQALADQRAQMERARASHARWLRERETLRMLREFGDKPNWEL